MKLKTSFFNTTVLKKDISRFAPVWALYTIFQILFVLLMWGDEGESARFAVNATEIMAGMGILNLLYSGLCAFLLFGDLFNPRMCNMLHAFPMRREGWFLTHLASGALFCLLPNTIGALLAALLLQQYAYAAFLWLAVMALQYLFFFGVAVFAVMCAGNVLGSIAVYGIFNFFAVLAAWLAMTFYEPVLYGVDLYIEDYVGYSPAVSFSLSTYFGFSYDNMRSVAVFEGFVERDWTYLFTAAFVGFVLLCASLLIYRRRDLENAGDLISFPPVAPVFLTAYTLCLGAVMYFVANTFSNGLEHVFLLIGFAIGFFTGKMLLEKKINVFHKKNLLRFGLLLSAFVLSIVLTLADPMGITRYVPKAEQVSSVTISPYTSHYYIENRSCVLTDPADISVITQIHSDLTQNRSQTGDGTLVIQYQMNDGRTIRRKYSIHTQSAGIQPIKQFYSNPKTVLGTEDIDALRNDLVRIEIYPQYSQTNQRQIFISNTESRYASDDEVLEKYPEEENIIIKEAFSQSETVQGLLEAILADCKAGNMAQHREFHNSQHYCTINLCLFTSEYRYTYLDITVFSDCINTVSFLKSLSPSE